MLVKTSYNFIELNLFYCDILHKMYSNARAQTEYKWACTDKLSSSSLLGWGQLPLVMFKTLNLHKLWFVMNWVI